MKLNELRDKIHENAKKKGFYEDELQIRKEFGLTKDACRNAEHAFFAQKIALIHSELSEVLEADRTDKHGCLLNYESVYTDWAGCEKDEDRHKRAFEQKIKNTVEDELADVIIRVLDLCGYLGIDIEKHVELKMKYNETREYKHGKNY